MIDLPTKARVHCSDGPAGRSTYVIGNPVNRQITHLVVKSNRPPFKEYLVPIDQVEETAPDLIKLKCTRNDLDKMEPFEYEELVPTTVPHYRSLPSTTQTLGVIPEEVVTYIPVKSDNIPQGELAVRRGARVEATDGYVGQVDELLINSNTMQVTHLVLLERHIFRQREITIPVSQIDHVYEDTVYLKLDQQSVEKLPTTPIQRWSLNDLA
jgi:sporulation protein YlmC with PRC-barrel domain